jgi:hypothetical protein
LFSRGFVFFRRLLADPDYRVLLLGNVLVGVAYSFVVPFIYSNAQRIGSTTGYLCLGWLTEAAGTRGVFVVCAGGAACAAAILLGHGARRGAPIYS